MILSPTVRARRMDVHLIRHNTDARSIDENFVRLAAIDHLRIAGDKLHTGVVSRCRID